jgi:hypothetical protein
VHTYGAKLGRVLLLVIGVGFAAALFLDLCDLIFNCGCRALWMGAATECNIHHPGPPDCPWCAAGNWGLVLPFGAIVAVQAGAAWWPGGVRWRLRLAVILASIPVVGGLTGVAFGLIYGYWSS